MEETGYRKCRGAAGSRESRQERLRGTGRTGGVRLDRLGAELAAGRGERDVAQALRAGLGGGAGGAAETQQKGVDWKDDEEVNHDRDKGKGDRGVEKVAVLDDAAVDVKGEGGEVRLADDRGDKRVDDVGDERGDDAGEGGADDDGDGEVDDVTAKDEVSKVLEHGGGSISLRGWR